MRCVQVGLNCRNVASQHPMDVALARQHEYRVSRETSGGDNCKLQIRKFVADRLLELTSRQGMGASVSLAASTGFSGSLCSFPSSSGWARTWHVRSIQAHHTLYSHNCPALAGILFLYHFFITTHAYSKYLHLACFNGVSYFRQQLIERAARPQPGLQHESSLWRKE